MKRKRDKVIFYTEDIGWEFTVTKNEIITKTSAEMNQDCRDIDGSEHDHDEELDCEELVILGRKGTSSSIF